ncbi:MAG: CDF family Co(II)/Ni(II) efflux transporter DmeF [Deltaproteobacteria bacterium]|jgi:cation diffusion facilitator family transporter|nr:CDF family Co(II)/Ni(II) efflux transporter DmeF [Deltaproteobacteria bacterium]
MHSSTLHQWQHGHSFTIENTKGERRTWLVIVITVSMMVIEIGAGYLFGSMALLADGWHMGTHAAALSITVFAYTYARRHADNPQYTFSTGKVGVLGGFASAVVLAVIAIFMGGESVTRLVSPVPIRFNEAIGVAVIGLLVNLLSAYLLHAKHDSDEHAEHGHHHNHHHHDHNLRAAYLHVLADALTSFLAIFALLTGKHFGWVWMDPIMGIVGAVVITRWSYGLLKDTSRILLDRESTPELAEKIRSVVEADADNLVADLHVWQVSPDQVSVILTVVTHFPQSPDHYKKLVKDFIRNGHMTVEVQKCEGEPCF